MFLLTYSYYFAGEMRVVSEAGERGVMQEKLLSEMTRDHEQMISEHATEREDMISRYTAERDQLNADIASTLRDRDDRLTQAEHDKQQVHVVQFTSVTVQFMRIKMK